MDTQSLSLANYEIIHTKLKSMGWEYCQECKMVDTSNLQAWCSKCNLHMKCGSYDCVYCRRMHCTRCYPDNRILCDNCGEMPCSIERKQLADCGCVLCNRCRGDMEKCKTCKKHLCYPKEMQEIKFDPDSDGKEFEPDWTYFDCENCGDLICKDCHNINEELCGKCYKQKCNFCQEKLMLSDTVSCIRCPFGKSRPMHADCWQGQGQVCAKCRLKLCGFCQQPILTTINQCCALCRRVEIHVDCWKTKVQIPLCQTCSSKCTPIE